MALLLEQVDPAYRNSAGRALDDSSEQALFTRVHAKLSDPRSNGDEAWLAAANDMVRTCSASLVIGLPERSYPDLDSAIDSFKTLYCRRCHMFDCHLHGCGQLLPEVRRATANVDPDVPASQCGPSCALGQSVTGPATEQAGWTPMELSLFATAFKIHGRNSCRIARIISSRTCLEVSANCHAGASLSCCTALSDRYVAQVSQRLRAGEAGREEQEEEEGQGNGRSGRWKRRARGGKAASSSRKRATATVRRRMAHSEDQARHTAAAALILVTASHRARCRQVWAQFNPCSCEGTCSVGNCSCIADGNFCEKLCNCSPLCANRFPGALVSPRCAASSADASLRSPQDAPARRGSAALAPARALPQPESATLTCVAGARPPRCAHGPRVVARTCHRWRRATTAAKI